MTPRALILLVLCTVLITASAAISVSLDRGFSPSAGAGERVFPDLLDSVNDVATMTIEQAGRTVTIKRRAGGWAIVERSGYAARTAKVHQTVVGLARLELLEPKTRLEKRYGKLEVENPDGQAALSKRLTLKAEDGAIMAQLIVGKRKFGLVGRDDSGVYLRKSGNAQSWLARGKFGIDVKARDWLEQGIIDLAADRIRRITIRHPGGETLTAQKTTAADRHFAVIDLPAGAKLISAGAADSLAGGLAGLELEDVAKADTVAFAADAVVTAEFTTFDGLVVRAEIVEHDEQPWLRLSANADAAPDTDAGKKAADEAGDIGARTGGWAYRIPAYTASSLRTRPGDLIEAAKPAS